MNETSKCHDSRRARGHFDRYLSGRGIDVGAGSDVLKAPDAQVRAWDLPDGDAQVLATVADGQLDFLYSSHCLEHMRCVPTALTNWTRVVRPGGHLYVVVPDYELYEKMKWPSLFNNDHKQTFSTRITRAMPQRENHWHIDQDLRPLFIERGVELLECEIEDAGFDYNNGPADQTRGAALAQILLIARKRPVAQ